MITIKEIARKAGVSIGTVDRVLHKRGRFSETTARRIDGIIRSSGYQPNTFARNLARGKAFSLAALLPRQAQDSGYWQLIAQGIEQAVAEITPYAVEVNTFTYDRHSDASFHQAARQVLRMPTEGLLLAPVEQHLAGPFVSSLPEALPFGFIDTTLPGTKPLFFVGQDPFQSGMVAGKLMRLLLPEGGPIAVLQVHGDDFHINERIRGFRSHFQGVRAFDISVHTTGPGPRPRVLDAALDRTLGGVRNLAGIFVTNADTHAAAAFLKKHGAAGQIKLIGYDLVDKSIPFIKNGTIDFIISQNPHMQGYQALRLLYRHVALREKFPSTVMMPIDIISKENFQYYLR